MLEGFNVVPLVDTGFAPLSKMQPARLVLRPSRNSPSSDEAFLQLFSGGVLTAFANGINATLAQKIRLGIVKNTGKYYRISKSHVIRFILSFFKETAEWSSKQYILRDHKLKAVGKQRFKALKSCLSFSDEDIVALIRAFEENLVKIVQPSNYCTVDESILAFVGDDMRADGVQVHIPRKPHPDGVELFQLCMQLGLSSRVISFGMSPRLVSHLVGPAEAVAELAARAQVRANTRMRFCRQCLLRSTNNQFYRSEQDSLHYLT
jgi:hypothetical protein